MTPEQRMAVIEANVPEVSFIHYGGVYFDWSWTGRGFGQLSFSRKKETGEITCLNECMGRESVRKILHALADHIADRAVLIDSPDDLPLVDWKAEFEQEQQEAKEWARKNGLDNE